MKKSNFILLWIPLLSILMTITLCSCEPTNEPNKVQKLTITPGDATLLVGETLQLQAIQEPDLKHAVTYTTSAADIASVSTTGLVTALKEGVATITAETDGIKGQCRITIQKKSDTPEPQTEPFVIKIDRVNASNIFVTVTPKDQEMLYMLEARTKASYEAIIKRFGSIPEANKAWWKTVSGQKEGEPGYIEAMMKEVSSGTKHVDLGRDASGGAFPFPSDYPIIISIYGIDREGREVLTPVIIVEQKTNPATPQNFTFEVSDLVPHSTFVSARVTPSDSSKPYFYTLQQKKYVDFFLKPKPGNEVIDGLPAEVAMHYDLLNKAYMYNADAFKRGELILDESSGAISNPNTDYYLILFGWDEEQGITTPASYTPFKTTESSK